MGYAEDFVNYTSFLKALSECIISARRNTMTLDEKVEAILNLCTTMTVQIQKSTDDIKELDHKVTKLLSEVAELRGDARRLEHRMESLEKGQLRLDDCLILMENRSEIQQVQMRHYEERRLIDEKRFQRLEDRLFPASANAA